MIIKKSIDSNNILLLIYEILKNKIFFIINNRFLYIIISFLVFIILVVSTTAGIFYGTKLSRSSNSSLFYSFYNYFRPSLNLVTNYYQGFMAQPEIFYIHLNHVDYQKLAYQVNNAREKGEITKEEKAEEVKAIIDHNNTRYEVKLKIRGVFLDHIRGDKWSFRINVTDNKTIFGMDRFSLSSPETKGHIHEWVYQKALQSEELINLRYKFVMVYLNGKKLGIYALEEFFEKRLIENNQLMEGIIVKPSQVEDENLFVYQENKIMSTPSLNNLYNHLSNLILLFKKNKVPASSLFDIDKTAKYFALSEIFGGHHGHLDPNFVCYFNPVTSLLEPIGYDSMVARKLEEIGGMIISPNNIKYGKLIFYETSILSLLFDSTEFYEAYIRQLKRMTNDNYIPNLFSSIDKELDINLAILYKEYPYFDYFRKDYYTANINYVKKQLLEPNLVKASFVNFNKTGKIDIDIDNLKDISIQILGLEMDGELIYEPKINTIVKSTITDDQYFLRFYINKNQKLKKVFNNELFLLYKVYGLEDIYKVKITNVPDDYYKSINIINDEFSHYFTYKKSNIDQFPFLEINNTKREINVLSGHYIIDKDLIVPKDYKFIINYGVELDLVDSANILSYSPIYFFGTKDKPITVHSSDSSGQGIIILKASQESSLNHVYFDNLSSPSKNGWRLTGSVTFYNSDVTIFNCVFSNNFSEDALNVIRSQFDIKYTTFINNQSDAIDSDYSDGYIVNSTFTNCGNDGLDISGSKVNVNNIIISHAGDKGISVGENSSLDGNNIEINNSEVGIASKDLSNVNLSGVKIYGSTIGFTVFQKKPEFGPASIIVADLKMNEVEVPYLNEKGSTIITDGKKIEQTDEKVREILYGVLYGKSSK